ncbi:MAG: aromatic amino acid lyase, partial [Mesorhizobium sp.]
MKPVVLSGSGVTVEDVVAVARLRAKVEAVPAVTVRLEEARRVLDRTAASGQKIYGLNTGLGANLGTDVDGDAGAFQRQLVEGRSGAVGEKLPADIVRAAVFTRAATLAVGGSGISPSVFSALLAVLDAGVHPVIPSLGSIGASDLLLMTALARLLIGEGEAELFGERLRAGEALRRAGLKPVALAPKDGLSLISSSAVSVGQGALVVADALAVFAEQQQAGA